MAELWDDLQIVDGPTALGIIQRKPAVAERLEPFSDAEILDAVRRRASGAAAERPVKQVELDALWGAVVGGLSRARPGGAVAVLGLSDDMKTPVVLHGPARLLPLASSCRSPDLPTGPLSRHY